jgi:hypothetical protein
MICEVCEVSSINILVKFLYCLPSQSDCSSVPRVLVNIKHERWPLLSRLVTCVEQRHLLHVLMRLKQLSLQATEHSE